MAAHMVLILDGISPGLTHQGIQWTHSGVQVEWKPEVTYIEVINNVEYYKTMLNLETVFPIVNFATPFCRGRQWVSHCLRRIAWLCVLVAKVLRASKLP